MRITLDRQFSQSLRKVAQASRTSARRASISWLDLRKNSLRPASRTKIVTQTMPMSFPVFLQPLLDSIENIQRTQKLAALIERSLKP